MRRSPAPRLPSDAGLTLVELLVVLVILGLIATIGGIQVVGYLGRAKADTARLQLEDIRSAIDLFRIDLGRPPTETEGLAILVDLPADLPGLICASGRRSPILGGGHGSTRARPRRHRSRS